eukprot:g9678.t1
MMAGRRTSTWLAFVFLFSTRKDECFGFMASPLVQQPHPSGGHDHHAQPSTALTVRRRTVPPAAAAIATAAATRRKTPARPTAAGAPAATSSSSRTALHATGFGPPPPERSRPTASPDPSAYYPNDDDGDDNGAPTNQEGGGDEPRPEIRDAKKVQEPRGIGTLFESEDEVIRELSSEEYLELLRDWAPIASFASVEAVEPKVKDQASCILTVLRGMAQWEPKRNADYTKLGSKWSFGAPIGAIKGGQVDALACLQVSEDEGVVVEWICGNPVTLGIPGNAVEWLEKGVHALCGKRLDLPVTISARARGEGGDEFSAGAGGGGGGGWGGGGKGKKKADGRRNSGSSGGGKKKGGSKKRR